MSVLKPGFGRLATLAQAFATLEAHLPRIGSETVGLMAALRRVSAHDVAASLDVPHFRKAAMDGYALRAEDTFGATDAKPKSLTVLESVMPGTLPSAEVGAGGCVEIGTGAAMPNGADAVVMVEHTEPNGGVVDIRKPVAPGENIIEVGSDVRAGDTIIHAGTVLEPRHLGVLAAVGSEQVGVRSKPVAVLFSTGPEIVETTDTPGPGQIFDINRTTLGAALSLDGCEVVDLGIIPDDRAVLRDALEKAIPQGDFVLLSGGSSLGGGDLVTEVFAEVGELHLHGVAVKPGKPLVVGSAPAGDRIVPLIGLPGYPMSALSDYYIFVRWMIRRALGVATRLVTADAVLGRKHPSTVGRYEFLPVTLSEGVAMPLTKGSSAISALASADGFIEIDENTEVVESGEPVKVHLF